MSRRGQRLCTLVLGLSTTLFSATCLSAQEARSFGDEEEAIAEADDAYGPPPPMEDCSQEQEAAIVSGEIIVCRRRIDQSQYRVSSESEAESRYAQETMNKGDPRTPNVDGPGIFTGPATVSGLCFIPPCPPPPAYIIDFDELPDTPEGSDAERVGQGLAPRGDDTGEETTD